MPAPHPKRLSVLIVTDPDSERSDDASAIAQALADSGSLVLGVRAGDAPLPDAVARLRPDVVVVRSDSGVRDVLEHIAVATQHARRPIALFTDSDDRPTMREALGAGVAAYVVKGLRRERVRAVIDVAVERCLVSDLDRIAAAAVAEGIGSPAVLIVGDVLRGTQALAERNSAHAAA